MRIIPTIDLSEAPAAAAKQLHRAFVETGFAYIVNHGIPTPLLTELDQLSAKFFALPLTEKNKIAMRHAGAAWRGYFPTGGEYTAGEPDQKEGLYFGTHHDDQSPGVRQQWPMHGKNLWPASQEFRRFPVVVTAYMDAMTDLGHTLMDLVARGLMLPADYFRQRFTDEPTTLFRIFNYPRQPDDSSRWGVGAHTDMGFLTILLQDDIGGLQVQCPDGSWIDAPPIPGSLVINIGDMLQHWTHGIYKATLHRVRNTANQDRRSYPFFFDPHWQCPLEPIAPNSLNPAMLTAAARDPHRQRWDGLDMSGLTADLTYGEFVWSKIKHVFPDLAKTLERD